MKSPFPGMDPYLESHWGDVHLNMIAFIQSAINRQAPRELRARVQERVYLETDVGPIGSRFPDIRVIEKEQGKQRHPVMVNGRSVAVAEPVLVAVAEEITDGFIEILDAGSGRRVVTVIEVLSPFNKTPGRGQTAYLEKRAQMIRGDVSWVEIDLLRTGQRIFFMPPDRMPEALRSEYAVCVLRAWTPSVAEMYPLPLRERLPGIKIPLRETDEDAVIDLQAMIAHCYEQSRYDDIDYKADPVPPLEPADTQWADELLRGQGLR